MNAMRLFLRLMESYVFILIASFGCGLAFPAVGVWLASLSTWILGLIFFLSALKIDVKELRRDAKDWKMIAMVNLWTLIVIPILIMILMKLLAPSYALPLVILAAMPAGMTSPLLAEIIGGRQSLALILTLTTSLLAPFTVPLMIKFLGGAEIQVSFVSMCWTLSRVIFIPFALAAVAKPLFHAQVNRVSRAFKPLSILLLGSLIAGVVSKQSAVIVQGLSRTFVRHLVILFVAFLLFHVCGYWMVYWRNRRDRLTITVCVSYLNFTLAIYLVGQFFQDPSIAVPVVLSVLPWSLLMLPLQVVAERLIPAKKRKTRAH